MSHIIAVDHGYGYVKTTNTCMITGITQFDSEPFSMQNALEYNGKYYMCGTSRQALTLDKTVNDNYYLLTLAAIAKELKYRQYPCNGAEIILAAGLPLTRFGLEKDRFKTYLSRCPQPVEFRYERQPYKIFIRDVLLYPQGYSAFVSHTGLISKNESSVILSDCGSWTLDVMRIDNGIPNANQCMSLDLGMIRCLNDIKEQMRRKLGLCCNRG